MKNHCHLNRCLRSLTFTAAILIAGGAVAQDKKAKSNSNPKAVKPKAVEPTENKLQKKSMADGKNRFDVRARFQFNISASFGGIGGFPAQNPAGAAVGTKTYDDGFVLDDPDGNTFVAGAFRTDNWQYQNASQIRVAGPTTFLDMNISSATATLRSDDVEDGVQPGFELIYSREIRSNDKTSWGLQGGLGYTRSDITDNRGLTGTASVFTESFDVSLVSPLPIPPGAAPPPAGGAGTLIPVAPGATATTLVPGGSLTAGSRQMQTDIVGFRFGPYVNFNLSDSVHLTLAGGGLGALINSEFDYTESTTIPGMGPALQPGVSATQTSTGSVSDTSFEGGAYVELSVSARLSERIDAMIGGQYQYTGKFNQQVDTHTASLNLEQSIGVFGGISFKF